jgi:sugar-specific transcriptional regulator TrmB
MLEKYLEEIGLSEKEAQVYLALLQVDNDSIHDIAEKTKINRTTVYPVLESLAKKGLVSEVQDGKKVKYQAAAPERLETFVERQKVLLEEKSARLKDIIPQIKSIQRDSGERPIIKFFSGRDGAISAYEEFYEMHDSSSKKGYFIYDRDLVEDTFSSTEMEKFRDIRFSKNVEPMTIYNRKEGDMVFKTKGTRIRLNSEKYPIYIDMSIIEDRIVITTLGGEVSSFLIKSKDIAETIKSLINYIHDIK